MKIIMEYDEASYPPLLTMYVHGAPHKRQHRAMFQSYRDKIAEVARAERIKFPIRHPLDLVVLFVDPVSPDLDHTLEALFIALDGAVKFKGSKTPPLLASDDLIHKVTMSKFYPCEKTRSENR